LLPLRSEALGLPAEALRAGFMTAYERDRNGFVVNVVETGDSTQEALDAYAGAAARNDIVVGPLARSAVDAIASRARIDKLTIALNHPDPGGNGAAPALPRKMLVMGLSIEDEARQVAAWASAEQPGASALIVSGTSAWQRRIANAFAARWQQLGHAAQVVEVPDSNGYLSESALGQLKLRVESEPPALLFTALDADQVRQVRAAVGSNLPCYGTSSVNPGTGPGMAVAELDGMRLLDLPWEVNPAHPAVMVYPRWTGERRTLDMDRLYALGIDAFRVAREITLHPDSSFEIDGVTGRLSGSIGGGPARFERIQPTAVYQGGAFQLVTTER
jgi:outer membrane PBP1 activator LpoA protein